MKRRKLPQYAGAAVGTILGFPGLGAAAPADVLPRTMAGLYVGTPTGTQHAPIIGPLKSSGGKWFVIYKDATDQTLLRARVSSDIGVSDSAGASVSTTTQVFGLAYDVVGDVIHIAAMRQNGTTATNADLLYLSFNMATETFSAVEVLQTNMDTGAGASGSSYLRECDIVVLTSGKIRVYYSGPEVADTGAVGRARFYYVQKPSGGSWSAATRVSTWTTQTDNERYITALKGVGSDQVVHLIWASEFGSSLFIRNHNADDTFDSQFSVAGYGANITFSAVMFTYAATLRLAVISVSSTAGNLRLINIPSQDNLSPAPAAADVALANFSGPRLIFAEADHLYIVYRDSTDSDLKAIKSTDNGGTWSAPFTIYTGTVFSSGQGYHNAPAYSRNSLQRLGVMLMDSADVAWKIAEYNTGR